MTSPVFGLSFEMLPIEQLHVRNSQYGKILFPVSIMLAFLCPNVYPLSFFDIWKEGPFSKNYKIFSSIYLKPFIHKCARKFSE
jgi:hypothetical protein